MSLSFQVLGHMGGDNALYVRADSGQHIDRYLFDCGAGCARRISNAEIQEIDGLFFSHLHMDHVAGFDAFYRRLYDRDTKPNLIWGPPQTAAIMQHRFQGYLWNLHHEMKSTWRVMDIDGNRVDTTRFELSEAFAVAHAEASSSLEATLWPGSAAGVQAIMLDHGTPCLGYIIQEPPRSNIDVDKMAALGLRPGPWVKILKESPNQSGIYSIEGRDYSLEDLRRELLKITPGEAIAYLTDFHVDDKTLESLAQRLTGCSALICEAQYRHADLELAQKHRHMTATLTGRLARQSGATDLVVIHVSSRYSRYEWAELLEEVRREFPLARFPDHWN